MDAGTVLGFAMAYLATVAGVFLLYSPVLVLVVALLVSAGLLRLVLLPFTLLLRKIRRTAPAQETDDSWFPGSRSNDMS